MLHTVASLLAVAVLSLQPLAARAADDSPPERWYGGQILLIDGLAVGVAFAGVAMQGGDATNVLLGTAAAAYVFGGPIVHWARGHTLAGVGSLGLRIGTPLVSGLLFGAIFSGGSNHAFSGSTAGFYFIGVPVGIVTASLIDAFVLAWEPIPVSPTAPRVGLSLSPGQLGLSLQGEF